MSDVRRINVKIVSAVSLTIVGAFLVGRGTNWGPSATAEASAALQPEDQMMGGGMAMNLMTEHHERLADLVGTWKGKVKIRIAPGQPWTEVESQIERELAMDGLYLLEHVTGNFMGMPFKGMSILGYDTDAGKYKSVWIENTSTAMLESSGHFLEDDKTWYLWGEMPNPMTGEMYMTMSTLHHPEPGMEKMSSYAIMPNGSKEQVFDATFMKQ